MGRPPFERSATNAASSVEGGSDLGKNWPFSGGRAWPQDVPMAATTTNRVGRDLREAREAAGLTRAELAALTGCSISSLGNIEQGAVPKESRVLEAARRAIAETLHDVDPAGNGADVQESPIEAATSGSG